MGQHVRTSKSKPDGYWKTIQERIDCAKAVTVLNSALHGADQKPSQLNTAIFVINKMLPSLQAVAVEVTHKAASTQHDLAAEALAVGIDPRYLFDIPEKKVIEHDVPATPRTPGIDE